MKKKAVALGALLILIYPFSQSSAAEFKAVCVDLKSCAQAVGEITGKNYIFPETFKGKIEATTGLEITQENAEVILSEILNEAGYTRVPVDANTMRIVSARDIRYIPTPRVTADFQTPPELPNISDYYMMSYRLKSGETGKQITRSLRPFLSRYGRIIHIQNGRNILIQDTARNLKRLYELVKENDVTPTAKMKKRWAKDQARWHELELAKAKACGNNKEVKK